MGPDKQWLLEWAAYVLLALVIARLVYSEARNLIGQILNDLREFAGLGKRSDKNDS